MGEDKKGEGGTSSIEDMPRERIKIEPLPGTVGYRELIKSRNGKDKNL